MHFMVLYSEVQGLGWEVVDHCREKASSKDLLILTTFLNPMECWEPPSVHSPSIQPHVSEDPQYCRVMILWKFFASSIKCQDDEIMKSAAAMEC
jgi:hypothetical protein